MRLPASLQHRLFTLLTNTGTLLVQALRMLLHGAQVCNDLSLDPALDEPHGQPRLWPHVERICQSCCCRRSITSGLPLLHPPNALERLHSDTQSLAHCRVAWTCPSAATEGTLSQNLPSLKSRS